MPEPPEDTAAEADSGGSRSIVADIEDMILDARTYLDAELSYQKTRASFVGNSLKRAIAFGLVAAFVGVLSLIALSVGMIIALTPLITAWGATAVVVGLMLLLAALFALKASGAWNDLMGAVTEDKAPDQTDENGDA